MENQEHDNENSHSLSAKARKMFGESIRPAVVLAVVAVLSAALAGAILLYDGAWFLFQLLDSHQIDIPQFRISFALMQWPAIWVAQATDSLPLSRFVFSLVVMATPPIALAISWWIVRKVAPWLIVWPAIGIFLIDLPGQMHWIATSIRTNQLFWPMLLAVFIGMPDRVVPVVAIIFIVALFMHPQISVFLVAGAAAAAFLAWQRPEQRQRLLGVALVFVFGALYRYGLLGAGYETEEASLSNQISQWERSVLWLPLIALVSTLIIAILVLVRRHSNSPWLGGINGTRLIIAVAIPGAIALIVWAANPTLWRDAIDYRGPSMWHSLIIMGIAFLDVATGHFRSKSRGDVRLRVWVANGAAVVFCITIVIQSFTWHGELNKIRSAMDTSETACIAAETLPGFDDSPLNFWSLPSISIGVQSTTPDYIVLPQHLCEEAIASGQIPTDLIGPKDTPGRNVNIFHLRTRVIDSAICWSAYQTGWHDLEVTGSGTRRWSMSDGVVIIMMAQAGEVQLSGVLDTLQTPNEVRIRVNGTVQRNVFLDENQYSDLGTTKLTLDEGPNIVEFLSARPASMVEGDPRELSISVINLEFRVVESDEVCVWQQLPAQYEELRWKPRDDD